MNERVQTEDRVGDRDKGGKVGRGSRGGKKSPSLICVFDVETTGLLCDRDPPYITQFSFIVFDTRINEIVHVYNKYVNLPHGVIVPTIVTELTGIDASTALLHPDESENVEIILKHFYEYMVICDRIVAHNVRFDKKMVFYEFIRHRSFMELNGSCSLFLPLINDEKKWFCTMREGKSVCNLSVTRSRKIKHINNAAATTAAPTTAAPTTDTHDDVAAITDGMNKVFVHNASPYKDDAADCVLVAITDPVPQSSPLPLPLLSACPPLSPTPSPPTMYTKFPKLSELHFHYFEMVPDNLHNSLVDTFVCLKCYLVMQEIMDVKEIIDRLRLDNVDAKNGNII